MKSDGLLNSDFQDSVKAIVSKINPVAIICFGHNSCAIEIDNCFTTASVCSRHYDILIISSSTKLKTIEVIDTIRKFFPDNSTIHILVHSESAVRAALLEHHPFLTLVLREGTMLYKASELLFEIPSGKPQLDEFEKARKLKEWKRLFELADRFLATASDAIGNEYFDIGVFLLHQTIEHLCIASAKAHVGYKLTTHNLNRLIAFVSCYISEVRYVFPNNTKDEKELFDFLRKGYSDVRYKEFYRIPPNIAFSLLERVSEFRDIIEGKFQEEFGGEKAESQMIPSSANE